MRDGSGHDRKRVPRQRRYPCGGLGVAARVEGELLEVDNFSKYGLGFSLPAERRSFPNDFVCELIVEGQTVHKAQGRFRHRKVDPRNLGRALVGISFSDETPVEVILAALAGQVELLRALSEPLRTALEHVFLLFTELSLSLSRVAVAYPEFSALEIHHFRGAFIDTTVRETTALLKTIGRDLDPVWNDSSPEQRERFLAATRTRLAPFFARALPSIGRQGELPLLYPGTTDLSEARRNNQFKGEELFAALVSTQLLGSRTVDAAIALETRLADALAKELAVQRERLSRTRDVFRTLHLCTGFGHIAETFLGAVAREPAANIECVFVDFHEPALLRTQVALQKAGQAHGRALASSFEHHVTSDAAASPFDDLVLCLDLKRWEGKLDAIVCPWVANHLPAASRMALLVKLHAALKPGGVCFLGKAPPPRPVNDLWPFLLDWQCQWPSLETFLSGLPVGFRTEGSDLEGASGRHWVVALRREV
jgi:SAM-dependent methyltransferase